MFEQDSYDWDWRACRSPNGWLAANWARLVAGQHIRWPFATHPSRYGFRRTELAERNGQAEDWTLGMEDGSRVHLWLMPDGLWIAHRDCIDPERGPLRAVAHWLLESRSGNAVLFGAIVVGVVGAARA